MNLPAKFSSYTMQLLGEKDYSLFVSALGRESPVSIRTNPHKVFSFKTDEPVPWCRNGFYLSERPTFTFDPLFHAGCYYVQEASSMFVDYVLRRFINKPAKMLDLCAAPGGKSTLACSALPEGSLLVANELIRSRAQILSENLIKWGYPNVAVTSNDSSEFSFLGSFFDVVLADVPCSGEGMFRKDPNSITEWSPENVETCWKRQRQIISNIWPCLKPGGILIYSTCTYNTKENEENIAWIVNEFGAEPLTVDYPQEWNLYGNLNGQDIPVYRFMPYRTRGEGFFLSVLQKPEDETPVITRNKLKKERLTPFPKICMDWLSNKDTYQFEMRNTQVTAVPKALTPDFSLLRSHLTLLHGGIGVAQIKGKDCIPDQSLAMSPHMQTDSYPQYEVSYEEAISYLRKETVQLPTDLPRGHVLLTYRNIPLGFEKNIGNRANNLYPAEWRIRSSYLPTDIKCL